MSSTGTFGYHDLVARGEAADRKLFDASVRAPDPSNGNPPSLPRSPALLLANLNENNYEKALLVKPNVCSPIATLEGWPRKVPLVISDISCRLDRKVRSWPALTPLVQPTLVDKYVLDMATPQLGALRGLLESGWDPYRLTVTGGERDGQTKLVLTVLATPKAGNGREVLAIRMHLMAPAEGDSALDELLSLYSGGAPARVYSTSAQPSAPVFRSRDDLEFFTGRGEVAFLVAFTEPEARAGRQLVVALAQLLGGQQ